VPWYRIGAARRGDAVWADAELFELARPAVALATINPVPVDETVAVLDRYTYQALTAGRVSLPGRSVHAGVWFRLLRSLLDEVSLALTTRSKHGRTTLERIWGVNQDSTSSIAACVH
jgi:hypothetical protein